ncbi:hypothetical protein FRC05_006058 [Tulasnella sp. 425]|nr:hypothetical protein FRC05_006058 [Tulasnella sp. 425]
MLRAGPPGAAAQQQQQQPAQAARPPQNNPNRRGNQATPQPAATNAISNASDVSTAGMPPNACKAYWTTGECESAFSCRFRHVKAGASIREQEPLPPPRVALNNADVADVSNPFTGALPGAALTPTQAHNRIKIYLKPDYDFRRLDDYYTFVSILQSANPQNNTWFIKDGQEFLQLMGDPIGSGIRRIHDVLAHPNVSAESGLDPTALSFQRGYLPVLAYFSSEFVIRSTLQTNVNALYSLINHNLDHVTLTIRRCMESCMTRHSFDEPANPQSGLHVFKALITPLYEYVKRFRQIGNSDNLVVLVHNLAGWLEQWGNEICSSPHRFTDSIVNLPVEQRQHTVNQLKKWIKPLVDLVERSEATTRRAEARRPARMDPDTRQRGLLLQMELRYQPPGQLREGGPLHENDHASIKDIRIVPPHSELVSTAETYLPCNMAGTPHHLPSESMERLLDIQFRLLREELIAPIRTSVGSIIDDLAKPPTEKTQLSELVKKNGGLYKCEQDRDSIRFSLYTDAKFGPMVCDRRGISVELTFDAPPGDARHKTPAKRTAYWESVGKKRLTQGGLVALIWKPNGGSPRAYLGIISSSSKDLLDSAKKHESKVKVRVSFFDAEVELRILRRLQKSQKEERETKFLIESPAMFESVRPFLETLRAQEPTSFPFSDYLPLFDSGDLSQIRVAPPAYAHPQFDFDLRSLFDQPRDLLLRPHDPISVARARTILREESRLDDTQAEAMVDALTSEVSLIQGPPGTGKSYTGIEILRVLIANNIRPILLIAFTNHALDNIIVKVIEKNITKKIVRLGSRSADETVAELSLDKILMNVNKARNDRAQGRAYGNMKRAEEAMKDFMEEIVGEKSRPAQLDIHLSSQYPNHHDELHNPPFWIRELFDQSHDHDFEHPNKQNQPKSLIDFWRQGGDLAFITYPGSGNSSTPAAGRGGRRGKNRGAGRPDTSTNDANAAPTVDRATWTDARQTFFEETCGARAIPPAPTTNRNIDQLLRDSQMWNMSKAERDRFNARLNQGMLEGAQQEQLEEFERLKERHCEASVEWKEIQDKTKLEVLANAVIIGCTTNGAAKLTELLRSVAPRVLLVEEAGQVLEAHILASLVPSIQHMILIGDPLQLRPTIENYQISADNPGIGQLYRFDRSLMERLSDSGLRMSRLDVQRRMRPEVSELIRCTLYPSLIDNDAVKARPSIRGMAKDVFFLDHRHAEGGAGEESVSKTNTFEVNMIKDLVLHLLRQGAYTEAGDIVVLCAYLGQLVQVRKALAGEVMTVVDERDAAQLVDHRDEDDVAGIFEATVQQVNISSRVLLRTVDNFQGEEGRVVILSLVRNSGGNPAASKGIGFLKSKNRTNVALSRAKEGMYILGNADDLARSEMWSGVIAELKRQEAIGPALPISCYRHPQSVTLINGPGQIALHAPTGIHAGEIFAVSISAEEIAQKSMIVLISFVKSLVAKFVAITPANVPVLSRAYHVWNLATGRATIMLARLYVARLAPVYPVIYAVMALCPVVTLVLLVVCGEPCEIQICPTCAPDNVKSQVVDFIMQSSLSDVDLEGDGLDSKLITLECGHVFTVETLDGICELASYYKTEGERWLQLAQPPKGLQKPPVCPLCRAPIKTRRYGRILKRVDLDMSEQNVANKCRSTLRQVSDQVSAFSTGDQAVDNMERELRDLPWDAFMTPDTGSVGSTAPVDCKIIPKGESLPVKSARFGSQIKDRHQLPEALAVAWNNAVKGALRAYDQACAVASTNSAHVRVWEAAVATLHHRYMATPHLLEGLSLSFTVEEAALKKARKDCGASSTPKADQRFRVEGCWATIHIRFLLVQAAQGISEHLRRKGLDALVRTQWADFIAYMLSSIRRDTALTLEIAEKSRSYRQVLKTVVLMMEAEFQTFSHHLGRQRNGMLLKEFEHEAKTGYKAAQAEKASQADRYRLFMAQGHQDNEWLVENFIEPAQGVIDKWAKLRQQLKKGVVYTEVSDQEKRDVLKAFMSGFLGFMRWCDG